MEGLPGLTEAGDSVCLQPKMQAWQERREGKEIVGKVAGFSTAQKLIKYTEYMQSNKASAVLRFLLT